MLIWIAQPQACFHRVYTSFMLIIIAYFYNFSMEIHWQPISSFIHKQKARLRVNHKIIHMYKLVHTLLFLYNNNPLTPQGSIIRPRPDSASQRCRIAQGVKIGALGRKRRWTAPWRGHWPFRHWPRKGRVISENQVLSEHQSSMTVYKDCMELQLPSHYLFFKHHCDCYAL